MERFEAGFGVGGVESGQGGFSGDEGRVEAGRIECVVVVRCGFESGKLVVEMGFLGRESGTVLQDVVGGGGVTKRKRFVWCG